MLGDVDEPAQQVPFGPVPVGAAVEQPQFLGGDPGPANLFIAVGVAARNAVSSTPSVCTPSSRATLLSKTAVNAALTLSG